MLNNFCSIHCRDLKFGTYEEKWEPTDPAHPFSAKSPKSVSYPVGCVFVVCLFLLWFCDLVAKQTCLESPAAHDQSGPV